MWELTFIICLLRLKVKVIGQSSRLQRWKMKNVIFKHFDAVNCVDWADSFCHDIIMTPVTSQRISLDAIMWCHEITWRLLGKITDKEGTHHPAHQRSGISISGVVVREQLVCTLKLNPSCPGYMRQLAGMEVMQPNAEAIEYCKYNFAK